jgi:hypothetical protein
MAKTKERVWQAADTAKPIVDRALHDEELRDNVKRAVVAAREVYEDLVGPRSMTGIAHRIATDGEIQENLRLSVEELRRAAKRFQAHETHRARNTMLLFAGITIGFLYNPWTGAETRRWLKEQLFGESDFGYPESAEGSGNSGTPSPATES